ncbi:uncharacterized protein LOC131949575 [Physella acuta]|uniref:uncharacterized protein LOC131949575 n=1 Tax=Physella acuta TaxID=109671 RepID=UPI0027DB74EE|nr:uncharacterized protein LOC131949575 [Physella acuta]
MFSCCQKKQPAEIPMVVDLSTVLAERAWNSYIISLSSYQRMFVKREDYEIKVPESYYDFTDLSIEPSDIYAKVAFKPSLHDAVAVANSSKSSAVSLETVFDNDTDQNQSYKFRFEKTRKSVISVSTQKGFTFGAKANFSFGILQSLGFGCETDLHHQTNTTDSDTFEETIVMEATSDISVAAHSRCVVDVQLQEMPVHQPFKCVRRMSLRYDTAPVYIHRKSNGELVRTYLVNDLRADLKKSQVPCRQDLKESDDAFPNSVVLVLEGIVKGVLASKHSILLKNEKCSGH